MRRSLVLALSVAMVAAAGLRPVSAADPVAPPRPAYQVNDVVQDFGLKIVGGGDWRLSDARKIDEAAAWAAVSAAAKDVYGAELKAGDATTFEALPNGRTA